MNLNKGKISPYGSKGILIHYHFRSDPKLGSGIVVIGRITCSFHACTTILSLSWDPKIKEAFHSNRCCRVYNCKYSQFLGCRNNWIIMDF